MSIEQLKTISMIRERNRAHSAVDALTEEAIDVLFDDLPKLLALVEAGKGMRAYGREIPGKEDEWYEAEGAWDKAKAALDEETK